MDLKEIISVLHNLGWSFEQVVTITALAIAILALRVLLKQKAR